jgi:hypothetical protein
MEVLEKFEFEKSEKIIKSSVYYGIEEEKWSIFDKP